MGYQAIGYDKKSGTMHVWDDELGHQKFPFKPYAYLPDDNGNMFIRWNTIKTC
jgi:hypothetical protein